MRKIVLITTLALCVFSAKAQDHMYSNFLAAPLYLNPALAGTSNSCDRLAVNYRNQYPSLRDAFVYYGVSYDRFVNKMSGGIGGMLQRSVEGNGFYNKNAFSLNYAFHGIKTRDMQLSLGVQAGVVMRSVDYSKLVFYDQIDEKLGVMPGAPSEASLPVNNNKMYPDFAVGAAFVWKRAMIGASSYHLTEPDESLINTYSKLPRRYNIHGSFNIPLSVKKNIGDPTLIPAFMINSQGLSRTITAGLQYKVYYFNVGGWYRNAEIYNGGDAVLASFMFDMNNIYGSDSRVIFGFTYDYSLLEMTQRATGGTIEMNLVYQVQKCPNRRKKITCPVLF